MDGRMTPTPHEERLLDVGRRGYRIGPDWIPSDAYLAGRRSVDEYWRGDERHPTTGRRRLLSGTRTTREYLDACWGHYERTREIDMLMARDPSYVERLLGP